MPELNSKRLSDLVRLASLAADNADDLIAAAAALLDGSVGRVPPDLSDEDVVLLEAFLDGLLSDREEREFHDRVRNSPALCASIARLLAVPASEASIEPRPVSTPFSMTVALSGGRIEKRGDSRRRESRSFDLARSNEAVSMSAQDEFLTVWGTIRVTLDLDRENRVDVTVELRTSATTMNLSCQLRDQKEHVVLAEEDLAPGFVQFRSIPIGLYDLVLCNFSTEVVIRIRIESSGGQ